MLRYMRRIQLLQLLKQSSMADALSNSFICTLQNPAHCPNILDFPSQGPHELSNMKVRCGSIGTRALPSLVGVACALTGRQIPSSSPPVGPLHLARKSDRSLLRVI